MAVYLRRELNKVRFLMFEFIYYLSDRDMIESVQIRTILCKSFSSYAEIISKCYSITVRVLIGQHSKSVHLLVKDFTLMAKVFGFILSFGHRG